MITDHVWRGFRGSTTPVRLPAGACAYMSCGRLLAEHERGRGPKHIPAPKAVRR